MLRAWLLALALLLAVAPAFAAPASGLTPQDRYELGLKFMKRGYYTRALEEFNRVRNYHRDDPASVLAELAIADLHFRKGDFEQARLAYEDFARLHPRHREMDYVVFRTGLAVFKRAPLYAGRDLTAAQQAVTTWSGFESRFPASVHAEEVEKMRLRARERLANKEWHVARFYARRDAWRSVQMRTTTLLRRYPDSALAPDALALRGVALHAWGQTREAEEMYAILVADHADHPAVVQLQKALARPAGEPPEEQIFVRPYRISSGAAMMPGAGG